MRRYRLSAPLSSRVGNWRQRQLTEFLCPKEGGRNEWVRRDVNAHLTVLRTFCADHASRGRLARLISSLSSHDPGAAESALAELELALLMVRAGFRVEFLPESQSRTADLECRHGQDRLFVEITAMVRSPGNRQGYKGRYFQSSDEEEPPPGHVLIDRILARILQKAKQLANYCAPVLLAITMSDDRKTGPWRRTEYLDLRRLAGAIVVMLPKVPQVSAVLLSLRNVEPAFSRSGVRLAKVFVVERSRQQAAYPRVRLLVLNHAARSPLKEPMVESLKSLL